MLPLTLDLPRRRRLEILCLGAHCDDIEIGCGATLMRLADERPVAVSWVILSSTSARAAEARRSAALFLRRARARDLQLEGFRDGFLPAQWKEVKECFEGLKRLRRPDLIFTHERDDRHQDHRIVCELTWNTFRDHLILEYEVPKYDGGIGQPNLYVPVTDCGRGTKIAVPSFGLQEPASETLVRSRNVPRPDAPARCREQRRAGVRRGVSRAEGPDLISTNPGTDERPGLNPTRNSCRIGPRQSR